ncbi:hypothetical protein [Cellvibrio polysaccharolyticus]|uniref:Uncharacterized protein n=1 Tax=Cellvibrio polysaccharolyticus TaxID=2082724 RepID=A0A928V3Z9_9GAMM|nr:hypothetical protein [Cellvibrio polysaccharolyticus]MBE8718351.1 hypothetical protein [Cellvibrio polysaccharolyticus]
MSKNFSHTIWLGAGTASTLNAQLESSDYVTLVEARQLAYAHLLKYKNVNIDVLNLLITPDGEKVEFTEYNLAEYSATGKPTGLRKLFPGIKAVKSEHRESYNLTALVGDLSLQDNNNVLIIEIIDIGLPLLENLACSGLLKKFKQIHIQTSATPLYENSPTTGDCTAFMERQGYFIHLTDKSDPDLPLITFQKNPLFEILNEKETHLSNFRKDREDLLEKIDYFQQRLQQTESELSLNIIQLEKKDDTIRELSKALSNEKYNVTTEHKDLLDKVNRLSEKASHIQQQSDIRLEKITELEEKNRILDKEKAEQVEQNKSLMQELLKSEAQIELIKEIMLKE